MRPAWTDAVLACALRQTLAPSSPLHSAGFTFFSRWKPGHLGPERKARAREARKTHLKWSHVFIMFSFVKRTEVVRIDPSRKGEALLRLVGDRVSRLYNAANYRCRQAFLGNEGVPAGARLEKLMKATPEYRQLPSDIAQEVLKKLSEAWKSYFALRAKWKKDPNSKQKPGLPDYRKDRRTGQRPFDFIPIKHPRSYAISHTAASVVLPRDRRHKPGERLQLPYRGRLRHPGKMGRSELCRDPVWKRWYLAWAVTTAAPSPVSGDKAAAVDLGIRIAASLSIESIAQALHFDGRELVKEWDYHGGVIALEQEAIAGSRGGQADRCPSSLAIRREHQKRRLRLEHALKAMAKAIATACADAGVAVVYLGHPKGVSRDVNYGSRWNGRIANFWSFDKALSILTWALQAGGIKAVRVGERGSSSECPSCSSTDVRRHPRWRLRCKTCDENIHADQAGSRNILKFQKPSISWAGAKAAPRTVTQRWTHHLWDLRSANPKGHTMPEFLNAA